MIEIIEITDRERNTQSSVGGKAEKLSILYNVDGVSVPFGFSIKGLGNTCENEIITKIREMIDPNKYYAVRSSANVEDGIKHSFAGQFDSFLGVKGVNNISKAIIKCMDSLSNPILKEYIRNNEHVDFSQIELSVFVQEMVIAYKSGILFTKDPVTRYNNSIINASYGLGDIVVSGEVTPDTIYIDNDLEDISYQVGTKKAMTIITDQGLKKIVVSEKMRSSKVLTEKEINSIHKVGLLIKNVLDFESDIEWSYDDLGLKILQARPIVF